MAITREFYAKENVVLLKAEGKMTIGSGDEELRQAIQDCLDRNVVLDLSATTTIDSVGLGELTSSYTTLARARRGLRLLNPSNKVREILEITSLISIFDKVYTDKEQAINDPFPHTA